MRGEAYGSSIVASVRTVVSLIRGVMLSLRSILREADMQLTCGCDGTRQILRDLKSLRMTPVREKLDAPRVEQLISG